MGKTPQYNKPYVKLAYKIVRWYFANLVKRKFNYKTVETTPLSAINGPSLIVANHITFHDYRFIMGSMDTQMSFVASENLMCRGMLSRIIRLSDRIIPVFKPNVATGTTMEMVRRLRAGHTVCIWPEGRLCPDGVSMHMKKGCGALAKLAKCNLVTFRIRGAFFADPNWGNDRKRQGPISGEIVAVYTPEQLAKMSNEEVEAIIARDLFEDAYARQLQDMHVYKGEKLAESLEKFYHVCPNCKAFKSIYSQGDDFYCRECGMHGKFDQYGMISGEKLPYTTLPPWRQMERKVLADYIDSMPDDAVLFEDEVMMQETCPEERRIKDIRRGRFWADKKGIYFEDEVAAEFAKLPWMDYEWRGRALQVLYKGRHLQFSSDTFVADQYLTLFFHMRPDLFNSPRVEGSLERRTEI